MKLPIRQIVHEAICDGEMDKVWSAIKSELSADITVEYEGGPVQVRFGDYLCDSFKRIPLSKIVSELISGIDTVADSDYYREIADALIKQGNRLKQAVDRKTTSQASGS